MTAAPLITGDARAFASALPDGGRLLGLDLGARTIGTALCDAGWRFASPATLVRRTRFTADKAALARLSAEQQVTGWVLGLPLGEDGRDGPRAQSMRAFARNCADLPYPILLWDERWSTWEAEHDMIAQDVSRAKRRDRIDNHAAALILQRAIDALATIPTPSDDV